MPAAIAVPAIAAVVGAGISAYASHKAGSTAQKSQREALDYAKEQEAQRRKEWEIQSKAAQHQWDVQQAQLEPYRRARAAILRKHGIDVPEYVAPPMPEGYGGVPSTFGGTVSAPAAAKSGGSGMGGALAIGALGGLAAAAPSLYERYKTSQPQYGMGTSPTTAGLSSGGVGYQMSPMSSPPPVIPTSSLPNWQSYAGYGVPGQSYQGE